MVIIRSPFSDIEIPSKSIPDFLFDRKLPCAESKPFVTDATTGASHSFGQVRSLSRRFGQGLVRNRNWKKTDVLCIFSFNVIAFPVVLFGCQLAQGIVTPANPSYTSEELVHQLRDSGARAIVSHPELLSVAKSAAEAVGIQSRDIFCFGGTPVAGVEPWESLLSDSEIAFPGKSIDPAKDLGFLVYSSGTTGLAKGVMLSHRNIVSNILMNNAVEGINLDENTVMAAVLPFYHIFGLTCILQLCCYKGYGLVVHSKFDLENFLRSVQKYKITFAHLVPPIILRLAKDGMVDNYDLSSMKMINSGAAPLSATLVEEASGRIKIPIKQGYGLTETSPTTNTQKWSEWKETVGSVGYLVPNMEAKIVSDDGKELGAGETGEIWFKGPNIMLGYLNNEKATKNAITPDGYFKTGDVGHFDERGNLYITDRVKELIKFKGFQVPPAELEGLLLTHPSVTDAGVVGVYVEAQATELPRAYVTIKQGVTRNAALASEIAEYIKSKVAQHKRLRGGVRFVDIVPKSASGKILRRVLRDQGKQEQLMETKAKL